VAVDLPEVRVIILSMYANEEYILQALHAGAVGYLLKGGSPAELELAIRAAARGEVFLSSGVSKDVVNAYLRNFSGDTDAGEVLMLTPRQREILQLITQGYTTEEIAQQLHLSIPTVEAHRTQLMEQLNIYNTAGLVRYAIRVGLLVPTEP
jgi:DNA-binding NarL/FixJ family response regulator